MLVAAVVIGGLTAGGAAYAAGGSPAGGDDTHVVVDRPAGTVPARDLGGADCPRDGEQAPGAADAL